MTVYIDLYFFFNFFLDLFVLLICHRLLGYHRHPLRLFLAALLGASYAVTALQFSSVLSIPLHLVFGILILLIACGFGGLRRFLRLMLLFFSVCFLLGGAITALTRGISIFQATGSGMHLTLSVVLVCALLGGALCLFWGKVTLVHPAKHTASVSLTYNNQTLSFQAYADTGNMLRDPVENIPVILANASLSRRVYAMFTDAAPPCAHSVDPVFFEGMPLRLIPCDTVGGRVVLAALRFTDAVVEEEKRAVCIALDFERDRDYCGYDALLPACLL